MRFERLSIDGLLRVIPKRVADARGLFCETFRHDLFETAAGPVTFVQENHSVSVAQGTIRGLHFQTPPAAQAKLVRVVRGAVLDVAVDIRVGSPTFGQHVALTLSADNWEQLWIPVGFAHGFCTLVPDTEVVYKVAGSYYSPLHDCGLAFDDPALAILWPVALGKATLSDKDRRHRRLADLNSVFTYPE
jgi:dTDP-4-dehydrorhamnose 3,5-epimerase